MKALVCLLAALLLLSACDNSPKIEEKPLVKGTALPPPNPDQPSPESDRVKAPDETSVGLANPASENCIKLGGASEILNDANGGAYGICRFPDGRECEEWALFRDGRCVPH